jgi:hypothetical protein
MEKAMHNGRKLTEGSIALNTVFSAIHCLGYVPQV